MFSAVSGVGNLQYLLQGLWMVPGTLIISTPLKRNMQGEFDYSHRKEIRNALKSLMTGGWSTMAERDASRPTFGGPNLVLVGVVGAGVQFQVERKDQPAGRR